MAGPRGRSRRVTIEGLDGVQVIVQAAVATSPVQRLSDYANEGEARGVLDGAPTGGACFRAHPLGCWSTGPCPSSYCSLTLQFVGRARVLGVSGLDARLGDAQRGRKHEPSRGRLSSGPCCCPRETVETRILWSSIGA